MMRMRMSLATQLPVIIPASHPSASYRLAARAGLELLGAMKTRLPIFSEP